MNNKKTSRELSQIGHLGSKKLLQYILCREAVIIYSPKLKRIIWTNASGANLFGGKSINEFLTDDIQPDHPFLDQIKTAARQLGKERIFRGFRVVKDGHSRFLQCEIGFIKLKEMGKHNGRTKGIIITAANPIMEDMSDYEFTSLVLNSMADIGSARAICDKYGLVISATDSFADLEIGSDTMEELCTRLSDSSKSFLKVSVQENQNVSLNLYALAGESDRLLIFSEDHHAELEQPTKLDDTEVSEIGGSIDQVVEMKPHNEPSQLDEEKNKLVNEGSKNQATRNINPIIADNPLTLIANEDQTPGVLGDDEVNGQNTIVSDTFDQEETPKQGNEGEQSSALIQSNNETSEITREEFGDVEFEKFQGGFVFSGGADPIRFAWTTNTDQEFVFVSEELARAVGPNAADIVGRKWSDVATVFGFDDNGEIHSLLKNQDTWSGKSVLWPVQGTDLHVPVDLAALPTFSNGRNFDGFRGFGIVRMLDTIVDPDETGSALVGINAKRSKLDQIPENENQISNNNDILEVENHPKTPTNIVSLDLRREAKPDESGTKLVDDAELTNKENRAFHEIGQKLRDTSKYNTRRLCNDQEIQNGQPAIDSGESEDQQKVKKALSDSDQSNKKRQNTSKNEVLHRIDNSMLSALPVPVLVYRGNQTLFANNELLALTGYSSFQELVEAGGIDALFGADNSVELVNENEVILNDKDGGQMQVKALLQSVPWDNESAVLLSFRQPRHEKLPENDRVALDIMRVSELQNILDTATDGIIILDRNGLVQSINQSAEALFGQTEEAVVSQSIDELFAGESHKRISDLLKSMRETNSKSLLNDGCEVIGIEANGGLIPLFITIGNVGASENYCVILRDMTPWKKTREELVEAKKQAEDSNEQKTEFLARISHEIRTPLNAIIGFSDVMIEERFGPVDNERYREYLRDINRSGIHVLDLINDLLDISKIEAGKMELSFEAVDLNQIVGETVALLQPQANGNRVLIRTSLSRAVPKVVADTRSIRQIVLNLVSNAIKFTDANGQVIVSTVYESNGEVALRVRDTGHGMSEEDISIALKPFRQLNAISETRGQGTGLGLPLTKALVEANKAYFDIESVPEEGTIVLIQFPTQRVLAD
ncbi:MAG: PAS domain-containing protein [Hyphomicrobiales bacterium]|nr:PAS domain-containing protein [Hyphomicrobiales bacterium]